MHLKALIIEDEPAAARRLEKMILAIEPQLEIVGPLDSVAASIHWFQHNPMPDLVFLDIHLGDGISFGILEKVDVACPIIFTTAYDEYAIQAFKHNSIDYLLKPVKKEELLFSMEKFKKHQPQGQPPMPDLKSLLDNLMAPPNSFKKRFIVNYGDKIRAIDIQDIAYFFILEKSTFLITHQNDSFGVNYSLDQLESLLNPDKFFRINRKFIISFKAIKSMWVWSRSRVKLQLAPESPEEVVVSTDRSTPFKEWLNR